MGLSEGRAMLTKTRNRSHTIRKPSPLPPEIRVLFERYHAGDEKARGEILETFLPLAIKLARRFTTNGSPVSLDDLIEEGCLGLLHAIERFNPDVGCQFSTYAYWWIQYYIYKALFDEAPLIRLPKHDRLAMKKAFRTAETLFHELERAPTIEEVAKRLERTIHETEDLLKKSASFSHISSLDELDWDQETARVDNLQVPQESEDDKVQRDLIQESLRLALTKLSEAERAVLELRFGLAGGGRHSYDQIEATLGLPRPRLRTLEQTALHKLRTLTRAE